MLVVGGTANAGSQDGNKIEGGGRTTAKLQPAAFCRRSGFPTTAPKAAAPYGWSRRPPRAGLNRKRERIQVSRTKSLIPKNSGTLFGKAGKKWLAGLAFTWRRRKRSSGLVDELECNSDQLAKLEMTIIGKRSKARSVRLMTIPGNRPVVASTVLASIGESSRF